MFGEFPCEKTLNNKNQPKNNTILSVCVSGNCICKLNNEQQSLSVEILLLLGNQGKGNARRVYFVYKTIVS